MNGPLAHCPPSHPHFRAKAWIGGSEPNLGSTLRSQSLEDKDRIDVRTVVIRGGPPNINTTPMLTPCRGGWVAGYAHGRLREGPPAQHEGSQLTALFLPMLC